MTIHMKGKLNPRDLERMFLDAAYSGERFFIEREDGVEVAIVPREDLQILETLDYMDLKEEENS